MEQQEVVYRCKKEGSNKNCTYAFFSKNVVYTLKVMSPLVRVLRLVDGERKPAIGFIYEAMDKVKEAIKKSFNNERQ